MSARILTLASLLAATIHTAPAAAQDGSLADAVLDAPCVVVTTTTSEEPLPFDAATLSFAGFIAGYASEEEAREMLADFERLNEDFHARCRHRGITLREAMGWATDEYLDGY